MSAFNSMKINASGLTLERLKMDVISTNIANARTTRTEDGGPYKKKQVVFEESIKKAKNISNNKFSYLGENIINDKNHMKPSGSINSLGNTNRSFGVKVVEIQEEEGNFKLVYEPSHPDANEDGYVLMPNINMVDEMISLIETQRAYEANVTAFNTSKNIYKKALEISKG